MFKHGLMETSLELMGLACFLVLNINFFLPTYLYFENIFLFHKKYICNDDEKKYINYDDE